MRNPLAAHPHWKQLLIVSVVLPLVVLLAVLAFAWPTARIQPRDLPVGVVGSGPHSQSLIADLDAARPGGFDVRHYADSDGARHAIEDREIYGAFAPTDQDITVFEASAASPSVAQLLTGLAAQHRPATTTRVIDVVPLAPQDPRGAVLSAALLPLTICGILIALAVAVVVRFRPALRQILALLTVSGVAAAGVYLVAETWLGALPHRPVATWMGIAWTLLAISSVTSGLIALLGPRGLGVSAALMVFVGSPFSGVTSAPEMLPSAAEHLGQWLVPGAAANLLRSTAYFDGAGADGHLAVLVGWTVLGWLAIVVGHREPVQFAVREVGADASEQRGRSALLTSQ